MHLFYFFLVWHCLGLPKVSRFQGPKLFEYDYSVPAASQRIVGVNGKKFNADIVSLGRVLFYDDLLSVNGREACGSCHIQGKGFGDGLALSEGFMNEETERHNLALSNVGAQNAFFWDGRATELSKQVLMPIQNHIEMGIANLDELVLKVEGQQYYSDLFLKAYGDQLVTEERIAVALRDFAQSLASYNTKYDKVVRKEVAFNASESRGLELFNSTYKCQSCHGGDNFNSSWGGTDFSNIGLDIRDKDIGNQGAFKVPSLRNVAVTAPYMHDGRFTTLDEVLDHYSSGIKNNARLDWRLRDVNTSMAAKLAITPMDRIDLIAFLNTLTDDELNTHSKFSDPFN
jgi:cytochrome c peroxidase